MINDTYTKCPITESPLFTIREWDGKTISTKAYVKFPDGFVLELDGYYATAMRMAHDHAAKVAPGVSPQSRAVSMVISDAINHKNFSVVGNKIDPTKFHEAFNAVLDEMFKLRSIFQSTFNRP